MSSKTKLTKKMSKTDTISNLFSGYQELLRQNKGLEAIDLYYHNNIHHYENHNEPLIGKTLLRAKEEAVIQSMNSYSVSIGDVVIDEDQQLVWGRMKFVFDSTELGKKILDEAFMQKWHNGLIKELRFFYASIQNQ